MNDEWEAVNSEHSTLNGECAYVVIVACVSNSLLNVHCSMFAVSSHLFQAKRKITADYL